MTQRFLTIAYNTFLETVRQPIYNVILLATALLMVLNVSLAAFTLDDDDKLLLDLGLSTLMLSGLFLASFSAAGVLTREIENRTVLTVMSKPITRPILILGKYAGLVAALSLAFYLSFLVFVLALRHGVMERSSDPWDAPVLTFGIGSVVLSMFAAAFANFFYGRDFATTTLLFVTPLLTLAVLLVGKFDEHWEVIPFGSHYIGGQVVFAGYLVLLIVLIAAAVALAASTRLSQLMTLVTCTCALGLGIAADYAFGRYVESSFAASLVPNLNVFWVIDGLHAEVEETAVTPQYLAYTTTYALFITAAVLGVAVFAFQKREVG